MVDGEEDEGSDEVRGDAAVALVVREGVGLVVGGRLLAAGWLAETCLILSLRLSPPLCSALGAIILFAFFVVAINATALFFSRRTTPSLKIRT